MKKIGFGAVIALDTEDLSQGRNHINNIMRYLDSLPKEFESIWLPDHLVAEMKPYTREYLECLTTTSYLIPQYLYLKFGQFVLCNNFRNPALLAKISSTLQVISEGRLILGIGAGSYKEDHKQYGYRFSSSRTRIQQLEEAVQIIRLMWTEDNVSFHGKYYQIDNAYCSPKPEPLPPIMIGGGGEKYTLRVVANYADWWNGAFLDVDTLTHKLGVLASHCDEVGSDYDEILKSVAWGVAVADSEVEAKKLVRISQYPEGTFKAGTPETIVSELGEFVDAGFEYFQIYFPQYQNTETTQLFAEEVIPELS
jgi:alkanesulfonate monooxygenase SsuD/methylene tetrahydromethanopterin reductase-like flavin-dependent oxidoreductase (luciferase family)